MTIYGKNIYVTGKHKKTKPRQISNSGVSGKQIVADAFSKVYGTAKKHKCYKCGAFIFLIKGKIHELEAGEAGCHEIHRCK